ncbi:MAG TPA: mycothiol system anti-sigma-R factor [Pseudonocardiaceae bacterium]
MSCGDPHDTNCSEVLAEVWLYLDNECDHQRRDLLRTHLEECSPCLAQYGLEEHLKALLARKCGGDQAPEHLRARLRESIRTVMLEQAEITTTGDGAVEVRLTHTELREG